MAAQYSKYSKIEDKHYLEMVNILKNYYHLDNIKYKNTRQTDLDKLHGVDVQVKVDEEIVNVAFRTRTNTNFRDLTIRKTASFSNSKSEYDKILNGECYCSIYVYAWINTRIDKLEYAILNINQLQLLNYNTNTIGNIMPNGDKDGSSFITIPMKQLIEDGIVLKHNIDRTLL